MEPFKLPLADGSVLGGIRIVPPRSTSLQYRPLIVGLHGSTYNSRYFDPDSKHTATIPSAAFGVPFVSIDRPFYGDTTSILRIADGSSFPQETGSWLHRYALPALWLEIGKDNDCNCIVILSHSLGAMGAVIAAAMHARDEGPYPLGGIIISGLGDHLLPEMKENPAREPNVPPDRVVFPLEIKDAMMFRPGTVHPEMLNHSKRLDHPTPVAEIASLRELWLPTWRESWAAHVKVPVMFGISEQDCFFVGTEEHVRHCTSAFVKSERMDGSLIRGAPHCIELSYWSQGWYARCFGFAMECSVSLSQKA
ncbi:hypothetical protein Plec18167_001004 [Paecilomyces lecythidis]|uniref:AB hydrolase-1 domain-containing protein n=1 Tax=Paecilomyces lecythidis TaxID=3004212 RepID=A0ABR3YC03_9EURO